MLIDDHHQDQLANLLPRDVEEQTQKKTGRILNDDVHKAPAEGIKLQANWIPGWQIQRSKSNEKMRK